MPDNKNILTKPEPIWRSDTIVENANKLQGKPQQETIKKPPEKPPEKPIQKQELVQPKIDIGENLREAFKNEGIDLDETLKYYTKIAGDVKEEDVDINEKEKVVRNEIKNRLDEIQKKKYGISFEDINKIVIGETLRLDNEINKLNDLYKKGKINRDKFNTQAYNEVIRYNKTLDLLRYYYDADLKVEVTKDGINIESKTYNNLLNKDMLKVQAEVLDKYRMTIDTEGKIKDRVSFGKYLYSRFNSGVNDMLASFVSTFAKMAETSANVPITPSGIAPNIITGVPVYSNTEKTQKIYKETSEELWKKSSQMFEASRQEMINTNIYNQDFFDYVAKGDINKALGSLFGNFVAQTPNILASTALTLITKSPYPALGLYYTEGKERKRYDIQKLREQGEEISKNKEELLSTWWGLAEAIPDLLFNGMLNDYRRFAKTLSGKGLSANDINNVVRRNVENYFKTYTQNALPDDITSFISEALTEVLQGGNLKNAVEAGVNGLFMSQVMNNISLGTTQIQKESLKRKVNDKYNTALEVLLSNEDLTKLKKDIENIEDPMLRGETKYKFDKTTRELTSLQTEKYFLERRKDSNLFQDRLKKIDEEIENTTKELNDFKNSFYESLGKGELVNKEGKYIINEKLEPKEGTLEVKPIEQKEGELGKPIEQKEVITKEQVETLPLADIEQFNDNKSNIIIKDLAKENIIKAPEKIEKLGEGANGKVYDVGDNKVVKVTVDTSEIANIQKIKGKDYKHFLDVYDVKGYIDPETNQKVYTVVRKKYDTLGFKEFDNIIKKSEISLEGLDETKTLDILSELAMYVKNKYRGKVEGDFMINDKFINDLKDNREKYKNLNDEEFNKLIDVFTQINEFKNEIIDAGIKNIDIDKNNFTIEDGVLKYIDVGTGNKKTPVEGIEYKYLGERTGVGGNEKIIKLEEEKQVEGEKPIDLSEIMQETPVKEKEPVNIEEKVSKIGNLKFENADEKLKVTEGLINKTGKDNIQDAYNEFYNVYKTDKTKAKELVGEDIYNTLESKIEGLRSEIISKTEKPKTLTEYITENKDKEKVEYNENVNKLIDKTIDDILTDPEITSVKDVSKNFFDRLGKEANVKNSIVRDVLKDYKVDTKIKEKLLNKEYDISKKKPEFKKDVETLRKINDINNKVKQLKEDIKNNKKELKDAKSALKSVIDNAISEGYFTNIKKTYVKRLSGIILKTNNIKDFTTAINKISDIFSDINYRYSKSLIKEQKKGIHQNIKNNAYGNRSDIVDEFLKIPEGAVPDVLIDEYMDLLESISGITKYGIKSRRSLGEYYFDVTEVSDFISRYNKYSNIDVIFEMEYDKVLNEKGIVDKKLIRDYLINNENMSENEASRFSDYVYDNLKNKMVIKDVEKTLNIDQEQEQIELRNEVKDKLQSLNLSDIKEKLDFYDYDFDNVKKFINIVKRDIENYDIKTLEGVSIILDKLNEGWISNVIYHKFVKPDIIKQTSERISKVISKYGEKIKNVDLLNEKEREKIVKSVRNLNKNLKGSLYKIDKAFENYNDLTLYKEVVHPFSSALSQIDYVEKNMREINTYTRKIKRDLTESTAMMKMYLLQKEYESNNTIPDNTVRKWVEHTIGKDLITGETLKTISKRYDISERSFIESIYLKMPKCIYVVKDGKVVAKEKHNSDILTKEKEGELKDKYKDSEFVVTLDTETLYNSFESAEKELINYMIDKNNNELWRMINTVQNFYRKEYTGRIIDHTFIYADNSYNSDYLSKLDNKYNSSIISARSGMSHSRTGQYHPISFDAIGDFKKSMRDTYMDYYLTPVLQTVLPSLKNISKENVRFVDYVNTLESTIRNTVNSIFDNKYTELDNLTKTSLSVLNSMKQTMLASVRRVASEYISNVSSVVLYKGTKHLSMPVKENIIIDLMKEGRSSHIVRAGRFSAEEYMLTRKGSEIKLSETISDKLYRAIAENKLRVIKDKISDDIISYADRKVGLPFWYNEFAFAFNNITGKEFDSDLYIKDKDYKNNNIDAIKEAVAYADYKFSILFAPSNIFEMPSFARIKHSSTPMESLRYMANLFRAFNANDTANALDAIKKITVDKGMFDTKGEAVKLLSSLFVRQLTYSVLMTSLAKCMDILISSGEKEERDELQDLIYSFTPQGLQKEMTGALLNLFFGGIDNFSRMGLAFTIEAFNKKIIEENGRVYSPFKHSLMYTPLGIRGVSSLLDSKTFISMMGAHGKLFYPLISIAEAYEKEGEERRNILLYKTLPYLTDIFIGIPGSGDVLKVANDYYHSKSKYVRIDNLTYEYAKKRKSFEDLAMVLSDKMDISGASLQNIKKRYNYYDALINKKIKYLDQVDINFLLGTYRKNDEKIEYLMNYYKVIGRNKATQLHNELYNNGIISSNLYEDLLEKFENKK